MKSSTATDPVGRSRLILGGAAVGVVCAGLLARGLPGVAGDISGGTLYAVLVYLLVALLVPAARAVAIGGMAFVVCAGVELLQLTGLPAVLGSVFPPIRLILGTTFVATDLLSAAAGSVIAALVDGAVRRRSSAVARRDESMHPRLEQAESSDNG
ncbi:hypothetical protein IWX78_001011 [Mycetocola sp. CAN_C7]|uniref:DUF2809 domain-containing protein n=1 Tax=Mycetocola sp. CAN_C7 TaxID=2787724 RepID=UPI0018CA074E